MKKLKQIFSLKSKRVTLLLGTFLPLFMAHIYAYACNVDLILNAKTKLEKFGAYLGYSFILLIGLMCSIAYLGMVFIPCPENANPLYFRLTIIIICYGAMFLTSYLYYRLYEGRLKDMKK